MTEFYEKPELSDICHYGRLGMKWGQHIFGKDPSEYGRERLRKAKTFNMERWGTSEDHNIAYVTGISGSGKSTAALSIADKNTDILHLDSYYGNSGEKTNKNFDAFLKRSGVKKPKDVKDWNGTDTLGEFERAVDQFGKEQYKQGRKVIAEGIQVYNKTLWENPSHYSDKPMVVVTTPVFNSFYRMLTRQASREGVSIFDAAGSFENAVNLTKGYLQNETVLNTFMSEINATESRAWVDEFLKH